jgi:hypothetical protein
MVLEQPEKLEHDHDNDNDSDDVEDVSVHDCWCLTAPAAAGEMIRCPP